MRHDTGATLKISLGHHDRSMLQNIHAIRFEEMKISKSQEIKISEFPNR